MLNIKNNYQTLSNFLLNCTLIISQTSLVIWIISSIAMMGKYIPVPETWETMTMYIVPVNFVVFCLWTYRMIVMGEPAFFGGRKKNTTLMDYEFTDESKYGR